MIVNPIFSSGQTFRLHIYSTYGSECHESEKKRFKVSIADLFRRRTDPDRQKAKDRLTAGLTKSEPGKPASVLADIRPRAVYPSRGVAAPLGGLVDIQP
ncbi:hypothetical protein [Neotabrizicola sp. VNH66]|uniref:hypothetical protein n=1 Tax=Neotabrizicola sp. VNH66 TaxID=3400918 RepID=UPI003C07EC13